jgi:fermentation-respiration switch protein FrsA (DUF1100 family)
MAYDLLESFTLPGSRIVVYGESLGTGVAVQVAAQRRPAGLVLESPFSSAVDVGSYLYPFLPVRWLLKDRFDSIDHIGKVKAPLLVLHGELDEIVPPKLARKLFAAANGPKTAYFIGDATHYTLYERGGLEKIKTFIDSFAAHRSLPLGIIPAACGPLCRYLDIPRHSQASAAGLRGGAAPSGPWAGW